MMQRMLRAVLVGLLSVSGMACKSGGDSPKSQPGVAAGKVVEVTGAVTVRHQDVARPLAKGETVEGEDVVETGADGNVVIELSHNLARWELSANKKSKVRESAAWGLPKKEGNAAQVEQATAAAGRHAERSAAETSVSAPAEAARAPAAESAPAPPPAEPATAAPPPPPAPAPAKEKRDVSDEGMRKRPPAPAPKKESDAAPPRQIAKTAPNNILDVESGGGGGGSITTRGGKGGGGPGAAAATADAAPSADAAARDVVTKQQGAIKACLTKDMQAVTVTITIAPDGRAVKVIVKGKVEVPAEIAKCVTAAVKKIEFAPAAASVTVNVAR